MPVHINREFISTDDRLNKIQYKCRPKLLASTAQKIFFSLSEIQIMEFIEKRKLVFLREGK